MLFQGKDGELRIIDYGTDTASGSTRYYMEVLFCDMNFNGPVCRPMSEEKLIMNRGVKDDNAQFNRGNDEPIYSALPMTFSCRLADTVNSQSLLDWISGATKVVNAVGGTTTLVSWDDSGVTILSQKFPSFADSGKNSYRVQVLWDGTQDIGYQYDGVVFKNEGQNITESPDGLTLACSGDIWGGVTRITAFSATGSGTTYLAFS